MIVATVHLRGIAPYSWSKRLPESMEKRAKNEKHDEHDERVWRERVYARDDGTLYIPRIQLKHAIDAGAKYAALKKEGEGNNRWTKHFVGGVVPTNDIDLPIKKDEVKHVAIWCHPQGRKGPGPRVLRRYPQIDSPNGKAPWEGTVVFHIYDNQIPRDVFEEVLVSTGLFIGIGRWRPASGGLNGRFIPKVEKWEVADV